MMNLSSKSSNFTLSRLKFNVPSHPNVTDISPDESEGDDAGEFS